MEDYAYVSEYILGGLQVADISLRWSTPLLVGWYQPSGVFALGVESFNGFVYVSDGLGGIQIYRNLLVTPVSVEPDRSCFNDLYLNRTIQIHLIQQQKYNSSVTGSEKRESKCNIKSL